MRKIRAANAYVFTVYKTLFTLYCLFQFRIHNKRAKDKHPVYIVTANQLTFLLFQSTVNPKSKSPHIRTL